jgi:hypothetical protein
MGTPAAVSFPVTAFHTHMMHVICLPCNTKLLHSVSTHLTAPYTAPHPVTLLEAGILLHTPGFITVSTYNTLLLLRTTTITLQWSLRCI